MEAFSPALDRVPPVAHDAERMILSACMIDATPMSVEIACEQLQARDFYRTAHGLIFDAIRSLAGRDDPATFVEVADELEKRGELDIVGGRAYIVALADAAPHSLHAAHYCHLIKEASCRRQMIAAGGEIIRGAYEEQTTPTVELLDGAQAVLFSLAESRDTRGPEPLRASVLRRMERLEKANAKGQEYSGITTGFPQLDRITGGLQDGHVIIVAGRTGMGKSAFGLDIITSAVKQGRRSLIFSQEMSGEQIAERLLSAHSGIDAVRLRNGQLRDGEGYRNEWASIINSAGELGDWPVMIDDQPALTLATLRARARRVKATIGLDLIIADYLQLMGRGSQKRDELRHEIGRLTKGFHDLAAELQIPVVALSQISRAAEKRDDKRPMLSDLAESSAIENDADLVLILHRPGYYKRGETDRSAPEHEDAEVIVAKHRHGPQGAIVPVKFARRFARFLAVEDRR